MIQPLVEGRGEEAAIPNLIRRIASDAESYGAKVAQGHFHPRGKMRKLEELKDFIKVAKRQRGCAAILVIFDADDECPGDINDDLLEAARLEALPHVLAMVYPVRMIESWLLASPSALREYFDLTEIQLADLHTLDPDSVRNPKAMLQRLTPAPDTYVSSVDMAGICSLLDIGEALSRSRSFKKFYQETISLLESIGENPRPRDC
jgi:hypothetical protein